MCVICLGATGGFSCESLFKTTKPGNRARKASGTQSRFVGGGGGSKFSRSESSRFGGTEFWGRLRSEV